MQSFFDYLNRKSDKILALDDSSTNEFGTMAKLVNQNIDITKESIIQDNRVINGSSNCNGTEFQMYGIHS